MYHICPRCLCRLTSRPYNADPCLQETFDTLVWDKDSLSSIIEYSDTFKNYFANLTKKAHSDGDLQGGGVRNLGLARHRFESSQKPLSRLTLWFDAAIATALYIMRERRSGSREHKAAKQFLKFINVERLLQAAMMCDGGDESLMLLRL